jgi:hypothetical protein
MKLFASISVACTFLLTSPATPADKPKAETEADVSIARIQLRTLEVACMAYKLDFGEYPEKLDQLVKPPEKKKPYLDSADDLKDPWGKVYKFSA